MLLIYNALVYVCQYAIQVTFIAQSMFFVLLAEVWISVLSNKSSKVNEVAGRLARYKVLRRGKKTRYKYNQRIYFRVPVIFVAMVVLITNITHKKDGKQIHKAIRTVTNGYQRIMSLTGQVVHLTEHKSDDVYANTVRFDTDSYPVKIDNCCTQMMSGYKEDFVPGKLISIHGKHVIGFANTKTSITHKGTISWKVADDEGTPHTINIPNSYFAPGCNVRLMSPQHWSQETSDNTPNKDGTWCVTYNDRVVLQWSQMKFKKTINIDPQRGNVATMWTEGGSTKYKHLCNLLQNTTVMYDAAVEPHKSPTISPIETPPIDDGIYTPSSNWDDISTVNHEGDGVLSISGIDKFETASTSSAALLDWHMRFGHMPFQRLQSLAKVGILPKRLANCPVPLCASCMYGKLSRKPWRYRRDTVVAIEDTKVVGECISVDQMETHVLGLIGQVKGTPTREQYKVATVFVDHASDYTYVYLQTNTSSVQTLAAKMEFERHATSIGVVIQKYHADNGRFIDNAWTKHLKDSNQSISLCGVNAHHQNGRVEKRIRDLQDLARSSILHAQNL
jgi:GAG-pre-integrase domain